MRILPLLFCMFLAGCATKPRNIAPSYVPSNTYESFSCQQLYSEWQNIHIKSQQLTGVQYRKATDDRAVAAAAAILFWPVAISIRGDGPVASELANLKGSFEVLYKTWRIKGC